MKQLQSTIMKPIKISGKALHSGRLVRMEIHPAKPSSGIVFLRTDSLDASPVLAQAMNITSTELNTTIGSGRNSVATIEHLMAAFSGMGIDNAIVKVNAPEVPILDGSAAPFVEKIKNAGILQQDIQRRFFIVKETFETWMGDRYIRISPDQNLHIHCSIEFEQSIIGKQSIHFSFNEPEFIELSAARTFCHINDVVAMRQVGLALGGSLDNAVVTTDHSVMNEEGLRFQDEFVRHKLLDCMGDLYLLGAPLIGKVEVFKPGHSLHAHFMVQLLKQKSKYLSIIEPARSAEPAGEDLGLATAMYG